MLDRASARDRPSLSLRRLNTFSRAILYCRVRDAEGLSGAHPKIENRRFSVVSFAALSNLGTVVPSSRSESQCINQAVSVRKRATMFDFGCPRGIAVDPQRRAWILNRAALFRGAEATPQYGSMTNGSRWPRRFGRPRKPICHLRDGHRCYVEWEREPRTPTTREKSFT